MKSAIRVLSCVSVLSLAALSATAHAALVSRDLLSPGDGLLTLDEATGLEWLDVSVIPSYTLGEYLNDPDNLGTLGFDFATRDEIFGLLLNAGVNSFDFTAENHQAYTLLNSLGVMNGTHIETVDLSFDTRPFFDFTLSGLTASLSEQAMLSAHTELGIESVAFVRTVPIPGASILFGSGILGIIGLIRRKRVSDMHSERYR
jgi:hypothetical protein